MKLIGFGETSQGAGDNNVKRLATNTVEAVQDLIITERDGIPITLGSVASMNVVTGPAARCARDLAQRGNSLFGELEAERLQLEGVAQVLEQNQKLLAAHERRFAEIMERKLYRELGHSSIHMYARNALGFSQSKTYQFIRLAGDFHRVRQGLEQLLPELSELLAVAAAGQHRGEAVLIEASCRSRPTRSAWRD